MELPDLVAPRETFGCDREVRHQMRSAKRGSDDRKNKRPVTISTSVTPRPGRILLSSGAGASKTAQRPPLTTPAIGLNERIVCHLSGSFSSAYTAPDRNGMT